MTNDETKRKSHSLPNDHSDFGFSASLDIRHSSFVIPAALPWRFTIAQWTAFFVALGVVLRLSRYLLTFPLSADEFMLAANFLDRDPLDLLRPLDHNQVAPAGFLWIEWAAVQLFGFSERSLRLFPALCAVASVFLFWHVAGRLLRGISLAFAMAIFSVAYYPIRYAAEIKPYGTDTFVALVLFAIAVEWWRAPGRVRWLWSLALVAPVGLAISFPAVFTAGGISLAIACSLWRDRRTNATRPAVIAWLAFNVAVVAAFLGLQQITIAAQYDAARSIMTSCWADSFPPWQRPLDLVGWLIAAHTSEMFAYPVGAEHGGSVLTSLCFAAGLWTISRRSRSEPAIAIAACFGLSLAAAAMHRYPYGGHARLSQYLAPAICLLAGVGAAQLIARFRRADWRAAAVQATVLLCALIGSVTLVLDFVKPWQSTIERDHRDFARQLWSEARETPTYCVRADLGVAAYAENFEPAYRCYKRIYSPVTQTRATDIREKVAAADSPLRCVSFHTDVAPRNDDALDQWMHDMLSHYELVDRASHEIRDQVRLWYDIYYFRPKSLAGGRLAINVTD
jgi:hypothetical protein